MRIAGRGRIVVWEGASLWVMAAAHKDAGVDFHTHHAVQITISLDGGFVIRTPESSASGPVVAVAADARHVFAATGTAAFLFIEPESPAGRAIAQRLFANSCLVEIELSSLTSCIAALRGCFEADGAASDLVAIGRDILANVAAEQRMPLPDRRVRAMIDFVQANLDGTLSLDTTAASACLSPSRARHLFAAETGLSFKAFVLWQRLQRAVERYAAGYTLTEAAHEAGFADSAHLSRTFRKTFGIPASLLEVG
jgi:AraC-like DNA-binding protein